MAKNTRETNGLSTDASRLAERIILENPHIKTNRTLARILIERYPDVFDNNVEKARSCIRNLRRANGNKDQKNMLPFYPIQEGDLQPDEAWQKPYRIPNTVKDLGVWSDFHSIYMEKSAVETAVSIFRDRGIKRILINGDLLDHHWLSRHVKKPNVIKLPQELAFIKKFLEELRKHFEIDYKEGNHDFWLERYYLTRAPELLGVPELQLESLLGLKEFGINRIHNLQYIQYGDLDILHGHEKPGFFTPEYIAKCVIKWWQQYKAKMEVKVMVSHFHTTDNFIQKNLDGSFAYGYVVGCMCKLQMDYHPYARRNHGLAICHNDNGIVTVDNFDI